MADQSAPRVYQGLAIAEGVAIGKAKICDTGHFPARVPRYHINGEAIEGEVDRFEAACRKTRAELEELAERVSQRLGEREADMIRAQAMMVDDPAFVAEVEQIIVEDQMNTEAAVAAVMERFEQLVESLDDQYLRERSSDIRDVGRRMLGHLLFTDGEMEPRLAEPAVVLADHLVPSLTVRLDRDKLLGFATEHGGETSHGAILARSLGIPAVTGLTNIAREAIDGETVIVDGFKGLAIARPTEEQLANYERRAAEFRDRRLSLIARACELAVTRDGVRVQVPANIGRLEEVELAKQYGAEGIGLYRTEVDYLTQTALPAEDALAEEYKRVTAAFAAEGVAFRALDIGGDKFPPSVPLAHERNPFIGMRGLRLLLENVEDLMLPQLRALIRASAEGRLSIMYPMIADVADFDAALELFEKALQEVREAGHAIGEEMRQGIMIEVPSAIPMLPELLERADFASVGTNDLVQYLLAADRNSDRMAQAYDPFQPAVIRTLKSIYDAGQQAQTPVSVCGEVASDPCFLPLLVGIGFRMVSVNVGALPNVKRVVRSINVGDCEKLAQQALRVRTGDEVRRAAHGFLEECLDSE